MYIKHVIDQTISKSMFYSLVALLSFKLVYISRRRLSLDILRSSKCLAGRASVPDDSFLEYTSHLHGVHDHTSFLHGVHEHISLMHEVK